ncbi:MAG: leucine-rich repeat domain-containing protein [Lentimicrobium sp.]|nr:leucine-rich repeat domain-containing protein [Lentimicrobium sp.]
MVTNKDVQAYLKDIDFFFKEVAFKFTVEEVTQELSEKGEVFFKVKTSRNLNGITIDGEKVNNNKPRFIEINLDDAKRELKIVSIYTTRSGEEEELISWWNSLDLNWRRFFAGNVVIADSIPLKNVAGIGKDFILLFPAAFNEEDSTYIADTLKISSGLVFTEVRRVLRSEVIDISGVKGLYDLEPLSAFRLLKHLNISETAISGLEPIRNLSKLETLIVSGSLVSSLSPLQYSSGIRKLDISECLVTDLGPVANFINLETLDISGLQIENLSAVSGLLNLKELKLNRASVRSLEGIEVLGNIELLELSGTAVTDLTALAKLDKLQRLNIEKTYISDIASLSSLKALEYVYLDNTPVGSIMSLQSLNTLRAIYCDKSLVSRKEALDFIKLRPDVKVIYESEELTAWWQMLNDEWKTIFRSLISMDEVPTREQLHELTYLKKIDVSGNAVVKNLNPLLKMQSLEILNASKTGISEILPVKELMNLQTLNVSFCGIQDLSPVTSLKTLRSIDISSTKITDMSAVAGLKNLRFLNINNCAIVSVKPFLQLSDLEYLYAEGVPAVSGSISMLWDSIPDALIIYQTGKLTDWWNGLADTWKEIFNSIEPIGTIPTQEQLHKLTSIRLLDLSQSRNISDLQPVKMLARLENLNISRLPVADIMPLSSISRLQVFNCSDTPVTDLTALTTHRNMSGLYLSNTQINDIDVVEGFANLKILDISGTQVAKLSAVANCAKLEQLDCYNTRISNLKALENMPSLKLLRIYNTRISSRNVEKFKLANPKTEVVFY